MDPRTSWARSPSTRLPRPRGDGPCSPPRRRALPRAPPPTRGWTHRRRFHGGGERGSPAHAGMDPRSTSSSPTSGRLPRPRGDGPYLSAPGAGTSTAPPPTRGWTLRRCGGAGGLRGSPAHAGMDPRSSFAARAPCRLPRPRGDGPVGSFSSSRRNRAPPPTRGWTHALRAIHRAAAGSPAHAGMDP